LLVLLISLDAIYQSLLSERRTMLHLRIAKEVERRSGNRLRITVPSSRRRALHSYSGSALLVAVESSWAHKDSKPWTR